jgi:hypothetical protein
MDGWIDIDFAKKKEIDRSRYRYISPDPRAGVASW